MLFDSDICVSIVSTQSNAEQLLSLTVLEPTIKLFASRDWRGVTTDGISLASRSLIAKFEGNEDIEQSGVLLKGTIVDSRFGVDIGVAELDLRFLGAPTPQPPTRVPTATTTFPSDRDSSASSVQISTSTSRSSEEPAPSGDERISETDSSPNSAIVDGEKGETDQLALIVGAAIGGALCLAGIVILLCVVRNFRSSTTTTTRSADDDTASDTHYSRAPRLDNNGDSVYENLNLDRSSSNAASGYSDLPLQNQYQNMATRPAYDSVPPLSY